MITRRREPASHTGATRSHIVPLATSIAVLAVSFIGALLLIDAGAYGNPGANPPNANTLEPLNIGVVSQSKSGDLGATTFFDSDDTNYFLNPTGLSTLKGSPDSTDPTRTIALDVNDSIIENVKDPQRDQDVATKAYVDGVAGLSDEARGAPVSNSTFKAVVPASNGSITAMSFAEDESHLAIIQAGSLKYLDTQFVELFSRTGPSSAATLEQLVVDDTDTIYVYGGNNLTAFNTTGDQLWMYTATAPFTNNAFARRDLFTHESNAYLIENGAIVGIFDKTGLVRTDTYTPSPSFSSGKFLSIDSEGNYFSDGSKRLTNGSYVPVINKYSPQFQLLDQFDLAAITGNTNSITQLDIGPDDTIYVTVRGNGFKPREYYFYRIDQEGNILAEYTPIGGGFYSATRFGISSDGGVIITAQWDNGTNSNTPYMESHTVRLKADGTVVWSRFDEFTNKASTTIMLVDDSYISYYVVSYPTISEFGHAKTGIVKRLP